MPQADANRAIFLFHLKLILLLFWFGWFSLASITNLFDYMHQLGLLPGPQVWRFQSDNYEGLRFVLGVYNTPAFILDILFICDFTVQGICAILFGLAAFSFWKRNNPKWIFINSAFALSISLWAVFVIMQEVFLAYKVKPGIEHTFTGWALYEVVTLIMIHILAD